ncbi:DNA cytosine methyltransferase [Xanthomonas sp. BRIP62418]|uniref:DNA cytosine methyltransferase n=1 Tax=Xanthomonas sp. BRIP62418 TaxID=2182391 RepID=UPI000F8C8FB5|nr:DNA cytosine methyltransferase [Xanthomonas sp. BRIP62418]
MRKVVDLFAGVGGLSLGAARAGFDVKAAYEWDANAIAYHGKNFPSSRHIKADIAEVRAAEILESAGVVNGSDLGIIGGPPCQGFSDIGKKSASDPRNQLFSHFFRLVSEVGPSFFVAENVPGILKVRNSGVLAEALSQVPKRYRLLKPILVKASDYGAPTIRTRVFFVGYDPDCVGNLSEANFLPEEKEDVRVGRALRGLPAIRSSWSNEISGWRKVAEWDAGEFEQRLKGVIPVGVGDQESIIKLKQERLVSGFLGTVHSSESVRRFSLVKPGKTDPISKCYRLDRDGYCPTLRAGTGPDRGSHQALRPLHPSSPRVISPREAARLQGFPDWFQFHPTKWHAFRQIGNSVSPIVAESILASIHRAMD